MLNSKKKPEANPQETSPAHKATRVTLTHFKGDGLERQIAAGYLLIAGMALVLFGWAAWAEISGAVIGAGRVIVETNEKLVQHPTGGVVGSINVIEGQFVHEGDVVMRLDDTAMRSNLEVVMAQLFAARARLVRLQAERDGKDRLEFPAGAAGDAQAMMSEQRFFESRKAARENQKEQMRRKIDQLREQVGAYDLLGESRKHQLKLAAEHIAIIEDLKNRKLAKGETLSDLQLNMARMEGEYGSYIQQKASTLAQITETEAEISGVDAAALSDIMKDMRETEAKIDEFEARRISAQDQLSRVDILAPATGFVHELAVHTVRGVINPGEAIMKIVPGNSKLQFEVKISPTDIDQVVNGQAVRLKFSAFNRAHSPEVTGRVVMVGADASTDKQSGKSYYDVLIDPDADMDQKLKEKGVTLVPGMPVEAYMQTGDRSVLSYLMKPFIDQASHAFREE